MFSFLDEQGFLVRILRWSERYTKVDMVYLAHGSFWLIASQIVTSAASFALAIAFARLLSKESFGTYEYLMTIFGIVTVACLRGMDSLVVQALARGNDRTFWEGFSAKMRWGLVGSLASIIIALYYFHMGNGTIGIGLIAAALFVPLMDPMGLFGSMLSAKKDFKLAGILGALNQTASAALIAVAMLLTHNPVVTFVAYCSAWTLMRFISLRVSLKKYAFNNRREPHALSYGWHTSFAGVIGIIIGSVDGIAIYHFLGAAPLAIYTFSMAPVLQARSFINILGTIAIPKYAAQRSAEIRRTLLPRSLLLTSGGIIITICYILLAQPFFHFFFPKYLDAVIYSQVFSLTIAYSLMGMTLSAALEGRMTLVPKKFIYAYTLPSIALGLTSIFLVQRIGIWGAIAGQFLSMSASFALQVTAWLRIRHKDFAQPLNSDI